MEMIKIGLAPWQCLISRPCYSSQSKTRPPILLPYGVSAGEKQTGTELYVSATQGAGRHTWAVPRYTPSQVKDDARRICLVKRDIKNLH